MVFWNGTPYYYVTNLQGDVIAILDTEGNIVVQYTYDAWGNILTTTGTLAESLGVINPLTYRGYVFDQETGLYYLQSRYYNPEIGRFINADALCATGQGLLGNNMFAYCNNNPVRYSDPTGERFCDWLKSSLGDVCDFIVTAYEYESNSDIETAKNNLDKDGFTYYKGVPVVEADLPGVSAFSYGIIVMDPEYINNPKYDFESTLKHEYGHIVHQQIIGLPNYTTKVAIPSLICASMRKSNKFIDDNYMSLPWEHTAEILGDVNRGNYADWAGRAALIYFLWTLI